MPSHDLPQLPEAVSADREQARGSSVPRVLALITLLVSLAITVSFWYQAQSTRKEKVRAEFDLQARFQANQIVRRMNTYEQVLRGLKGRMNGSLDIRYEDFRNYVESLELGENYPGIQGIAISEIVLPAQLDAHAARLRADGLPEFRIWPPGPREIYTAVTRIEPLSVMNQRALGFDMYSEPTRRAAMERARDTGRPALSAKVKLVQEDVTEIQAGALMYLPVYRSGMPTMTVGQRRAAILGWVYAPFRIGDLISALEVEREGDFTLSVFDGGTRSAASCLYRCSESALAAPAHELATSIALMIAGRPWLVDIRATPQFVARGAGGTSVVIAAGGMVTSLLLALLVWVLSTSRQRAVALATVMTAELRASSERTLAERRRLELILGNAYDAFVAFSRDGRITYWNEQAARTFGWSAHEAIGRDLLELIAPTDQRAAYREAIASIASAGSALPARRIEVQARRRDGQPIFVEMSVVVIEGEGGASFNAFIRDFTERMELEQREREQQASLERTRRALEGAQRLEAIGMLTGGVAHDFNNVLQIISGNVQLMMHGLRPEQQERRLRSIADAVERGAKLSSQLLTFARRQQLRPQPVNLRGMLANIDDLIKRAVGDGVTVGVLAEHGLWDVLVDVAQLENVILNLAINARDAMQGRGNFEIALSNVTLDARAAATIPELEAGDYVTLKVRDTGAGMAPEVRARAFEPFFTTKSEGGGSGLGLAMAYGFVKQSGGHIEIDSEPGRGATVTIYLPRSRKVAQARVQGRPERAVEGGRGETILVVDDDRAVQDMAVEILEDLGYRVLRADDGESALKVLEREGAVDLLFTDVVMPGPVSSTDLVRMATERQANLAVLFTSGFARNLMAKARDLMPGAPLLSKPYQREQLAHQVRELLDARQPSDLPG